MKKRRRTRAEVDSLLGRYHQSGLTVRGFSEAEGVTTSSLYKWLRRQKPTEASPVIMEVTPEAGQAAGYSIATPGGYRIDLPRSFSTHELQRLLGVLEE